MGVIVFLTWGVLAVAVASWANGKGRNAGLAFLIALFFSPLVGFIVVACLKDKTRDAVEARRHAELLAAAAPTVPAGDVRPCPFCAEPIRKAAKVCRFCNREISPV
ncbi:MAG TPA: hypothetical protein PLH23_04960 [Hyphomonadaceae bacterium]|nr:hypothetical protein [Hyphomonadaceae bacterium]HPI47596.1 hypothetical protein [Hyphomonadaceae bacterium]